MSEVTAKRAEIVAAGKPLRITTVPLPPLPPNMVRIKVAFAGVCHSDVHFLNNFEEYRKKAAGGTSEGLVMGHEISGFIEEIGKDVNDGKFSVGDHIVLCPWKGCVNCEYCQIGSNNQCPNNPAGSYDVGQSADNPGGYQSHINAYPEFLVKVEPSLGLDVACMLPCSASTVYSALKKVGDIIKIAAKRSGTARLLIIGAGGLGLWAVTLGKAMFNNIHITAADIDGSKLTLAKETGADDTVVLDGNATAQESKENITKGGMFDAAIDFVGASSTSETAVNSLKHGGGMVLIGLFRGSLSCPIMSLIGRSITVRGSRTSSRQDIAEVVDLVVKKGLTFPKIQYIKHEDINKALDNLAKGKIQGRCVIKY